MELFECPDCHRMHDEPAEATARLHVRCLDCELELRYHEGTRVEATLVVVEVAKAA